MGDIARCSLGKSGDFYNEELLYKTFGVQAELLIDHAWGWEPCTIADIRAYRPDSNSISSGQVLQEPYDWHKAKLIVREMTDLLVLDLVKKRLCTDQLTLTIGYDIENLSDPARAAEYAGETHADRYGRRVPKHGHGTANLAGYSSSTRDITDAVMALYDRITDKNLLVRRVTVAGEPASCRRIRSPARSRAVSSWISFPPRRRRGARPARIQRRASANGAGRRPFSPSSGGTAITPF